MNGTCLLLARLYESILPLDDDIAANLAQPLDVFCVAEDMSFSGCDDMRGAWRNYCIGVVGHVANEEHEILWPNQVPTHQTVTNSRFHQSYLHLFAA